MGKKTRLGAAILATVVAGTLAPSAARAQSGDGVGTPGPGFGPSGNTVYRMSGLDRYEVAVRSAERFRVDYQAANEQAPSTYILASGQVWPDGLTAAPLADCLDAPVLLVQQKSIPPVVKSFLSAHKDEITKIIITGGPGTIDPVVMSDLVGVFGPKMWLPTDPDQVGVERISGADRYEVAYNTAADTAACLDPNRASSGVLAGAKETLSIATTNEAAYQYWLARWTKARADYVAAEKALNDAKAQVAALQDQLDALAAKLLPVGPPPAGGITNPATTNTLCVGGVTWAACLDGLQANLEAAAEAQADAAAAVNFFTTNLGQLDTNSTLDQDSPLSEYLALPAISATEKAWLNNYIATNTLGINGGTTLEQARLLVVQDLAAKSGAWSEINKDFAYVAAEYARVSAANTANAAIIAQMAAIQVKINALMDSITKPITGLQAKYNAALEELGLSQEMLANATASRPTPTAIANATAAVKAARDNVVRNSADRTAFLATGSIFTDALSTGPAAADQDDVLLLTQGATLGPWAKKWLDLSKSQAVGVGGQAAAAIKGAAVINKFATVEGADRYSIAAALAAKYFPTDRSVAIASGEIFSDAVTAGSFISQYDGYLLLAQKNSLPNPTDNRLRQTGDIVATIVGGPGTISPAVSNLIQAALAYL